MSLALSLKRTATSVYELPKVNVCKVCEAPAEYPLLSSIDMYNNDVGKESAQKFMKQTGALKDATLYFAS